MSLASSTSLSTVVVGGLGQMGRLIMDRCHAAGLAAWALDRPMTPEELDRVSEADHVLLAVPMPAVDGALETLAPHMRADQLLSDIASVKVQPLERMLARHPGVVVGAHPLFGPDPGEAVRVAITPGRGEAEDVAALQSWYEALGFQPFVCTAEEHDQAMAQIQGLNFVTTVAYLATLSHQPGMEQFLTPSFQRRLDASRKMLTEDAQLFTDMFDANPFSQDAVRRYRNFLHVAAGGDIDLLVQRAQSWWPDGPNMRNPDKTGDDNE